MPIPFPASAPCNGQTSYRQPAPGVTGRPRDHSALADEDEGGKLGKDVGRNVVLGHSLKLSKMRETAKHTFLSGMV